MVAFIGIWIAAGLTLCIFSFLYKDNPFYKIAEYIFVGLSAGYWAAFLWWNYAFPNLFEPLWQGNYWNIIPIVLGLMMFTQLTKRSSWLVRFPLTFVLGVSLGLQIVAAVEGDLVAQQKVPTAAREHAHAAAHGIVPVEAVPADLVEEQVVVRRLTIQEHAPLAVARGQPLLAILPDIIVGQDVVGGQVAVDGDAVARIGADDVVADLVL